MIRRYEHPGKFEGETLVTVALWELTMHGDGKTIGGEDGGDSWRRLEGPFDNVELSADEGGPLNEDEREMLHNRAGAILHESSNGFVSLRLIRAQSILDGAWKALQAELYPEDEDEDEDDTRHEDEDDEDEDENEGATS